MGYMRVKVGQGKVPGKNDTQISITSEGDFSITPGGESAAGIGNWNGTLEYSTDGGETWTTWDKTQPISTTSCKQQVGVQGTSTTGVSSSTQFVFTSSGPFSVKITDSYPLARSNSVVVSTDGGSTWSTLSSLSGDGATVYSTTASGGTYSIIVKGTDNATTFDGDVSIKASGGSKITLSTPSGNKTWTGDVTVSVGGSGELKPWEGTSGVGSERNPRIDIRGTGNTIITGEPSVAPQEGWVLNATDPVKIVGNLASLLDHREVACGRDPQMGDYAFAYLFSGWTQLVTAPELPQDNLSVGCFEGTFFGCTGLKNTPTFPGPDVEIPEGAFKYAFSGSGIVYSAPLPARTVGAHGYSGMFYECSHLWTQPPIGGTAFGTGSCSSMFANSGIRYADPPKPAALPAECYQNMYSGCISLWGSAAIVSTVAGVACCAGMFMGCTAMLAVPAIGFLAGAAYCLYQCFKGCSSITDTSGLPDISPADHSMDDIFDDCPQLSAIYTPDTNYRHCIVSNTRRYIQGAYVDEGWWVIWYRDTLSYSSNARQHTNPPSTVPILDGATVSLTDCYYKVFSTYADAMYALGDRDTEYTKISSLIVQNVDTSRVGRFLVAFLSSSAYGTDDTFNRASECEISRNPAYPFYYYTTLSYTRTALSPLEYDWIDVQ